MSEKLEALKSINGLVADGWQIVFNQVIPLPQNMKGEEELIKLLWEIIKNEK
jgi:hypothetical protein